jgi:hypothetical protein
VYPAKVRCCFLVLIAVLVVRAQTATSGKAESICVAQQSIWKQGIEFRHTLCPPGIDVEVSPKPVPGFAGAASPLAYFVGIHNYSRGRVDTDPAQWRLLWTEKKGTPREGAALSARQVGYSRLKQSFGRSTLFAEQPASGFVYFKKPRSRDAAIAIVIEPDQGSPVTVQITVSAVPESLLP